MGAGSSCGLASDNTSGGTAFRRSVRQGSGAGGWIHAPDPRINYSLGGTLPVATAST